MLCLYVSLQGSLRALFHLSFLRGVFPPDPCLHHAPAEHLLPAWPGLCVPLGNQALLQHLTHGFAAPWLCPGMVIPCKGHPAWLAEPLLHPAITVAIPPFAQTPTQRGLQAIAGNAAPRLMCDLLPCNSSKKVVLFQSPSWSHLTQSAGLCSTVCPLSLPVFTRLQGATHLLAPLQESCGLTDTWANTSCGNVFLRFPCF